MKKRQHRRYKYLINNKLQLHYAFYTAITLSFVCITASLFLSLGIWNLVVKEFSKESLTNRLHTASRMNDYAHARQTMYKNSALRLSDYNDVELLSIREKEILQNIIMQNNKELLLKICILFMFIILGTIFLTHKIAGPMYRLQQTFRMIKDGNLTARVHFRKNDHAQDLIPDFNSMIGGIDYSFSKIQILTQALIKEIETGTASADTIARHKLELEHELNRYTTSHGYTLS